jgi:hypothetical protein
MSLAINPSLVEKKIFTTILPFPSNQAVGWCGYGGSSGPHFVIGRTSIPVLENGLILISNNGINWDQINYPRELGYITEINATATAIFVKMYTGVYNTYRLDDIINETPLPIWSSLSTNPDRILPYSNSSYAYIKPSGSGGNATIVTPVANYIIPEAGNNLKEVSPNFFGSYETIYYSGSDWWGNYKTLNISQISSELTSLSSPIFESQGFGGGRGVAFAFVNNFTKIIRADNSGVLDPVFEVIPFNETIPNFSNIQACVSENKEIWVSWCSGGNTNRIFSPNFGISWFNLSTITGCVLGRFFSSSDCKRQLYSQESEAGYMLDGFNPPISINYGR